MPDVFIVLCFSADIWPLFARNKDDGFRVECQDSQLAHCHLLAFTIEAANQHSPV